MYLLNGLRVSMLMHSGFEINEIIEEAALKVTYLSESEYFPLFPVFVLPYVAIVSRFHLEVVKQIEIGLKENKNPIDFYEILNKDLHALKILASRYKRVEVSYGSMMKEMDAILKKQNSSQQEKITEFISPSDLQPLIDEQPLSFFLGVVNEAINPFGIPNNNQDGDSNLQFNDFTQILSPEFSFF